MFEVTYCDLKRATPGGAAVNRWLGPDLSHKIEGMSYWGEVTRRAATEAAMDVRLGRVSLAAIIVGQLILAVILFIAAGFASANLPTRIASAILPLLIFPIFFLFRLLTVPAALDAERRAEIAAQAQAFEDYKWALIGGDNAKRHILLSQFRDLYKLDTDDLSPELLANLAWPPYRLAQSEAGTPRRKMAGGLH
jgi:hypothetical protein